MTRNKKKLRWQERIGTIPKATQIALLAGLLLVGGIEAAWGASPIAISDTHQVGDGAAETYTTIDVNNGGTLTIARNAKVSGSDVTVNTGGMVRDVVEIWCHFGADAGKVAANELSHQLGHSPERALEPREFGP